MSCMPRSGRGGVSIFHLLEFGGWGIYCNKFDSRTNNIPCDSMLPPYLFII